MKIGLEKLMKLDKEYNKYLNAIEKNKAEIYYKNVKFDKKNTKFIKDYIEYWKCIYTISKEVLDTMAGNNNA